MPETLNPPTEEEEREEQENPPEECSRCQNTLADEEGYSVETSRGKWEEFCSSCHHDQVDDCKICDEETDPAQISGFILLKTEAAKTMGFLPGVYRVRNRPLYYGSMLGGGHMSRSSLLFLDKLPKPDENYGISGHICRGCAGPYAKIWRENYRTEHTQTLREQVIKTRKDRIEKSKALEIANGDSPPKHWDNPYEPHLLDLLQAAEVNRARKVIAAHPEMLLDLECDPSIQPEPGEESAKEPRRFDDSTWKDICNALELPDEVRYGTKTYHDWIFVDHRGVKIYYAGYKRADSWMTLHPEPRFRTNGHGGQAFAISGLPNWKTHKDAELQKRAESLMETFKGIHKPTKTLEEYKEYISPYDTERAIAKDVVIEAIQLGWITQAGFNIPRKPKGYIPC